MHVHVCTYHTHVHAPHVYKEKGIYVLQVFSPVIPQPVWLWVRVRVTGGAHGLPMPSEEVFLTSMVSFPPESSLATVEPAPWWQL